MAEIIGTFRTGYLCHVVDSELFIALYYTHRQYVEQTAEVKCDKKCQSSQSEWRRDGTSNYNLITELSSGLCTDL